MALSSAQLEAFAAISRTRSFSLAAKSLNVTQSALSQRIQNLESELETALIVRDPSGLRLTAAGEDLLRYCQVKESLESDVLARISSAQGPDVGNIRIGGFSSSIRSVIMPALDDLIATYPGVNVELFVREVRELPRMLGSSEVDLIVTVEEPLRQDIESHLLGYEVNVLVESDRISTARKSVYLDHDPDDLVTKTFLHDNGRDSNVRRNYFDEVYGIMDGVKRGWGRAVLPRHLLRQEPGLRVIKGYRPLRLPVYLQYIRQPYYARMHTKIVEEILAKAPVILNL